MIRISTLKGPVTVELAGPYSGVSLTLRRLTTVEWSRARDLALGLVRDRESFAAILTRHDLVATAGDLSRALTDLDFQTGFAMWLGSVEAGLAAISCWQGIEAEEGPAPLAKDLTKVAGVAIPADPRDLAARIAMETLMLDSGFERQAMAQIEAAARILAVEGNALGSSANGSAGAAPTVEGPNGAPTATRQKKAAQDLTPGGAAGTGPAASAH